MVSFPLWKIVSCYLFFRSPFEACDLPATSALCSLSSALGPSQYLPCLLTSRSGLCLLQAHLHDETLRGYAGASKKSLPFIVPHVGGGKKKHISCCHPPRCSTAEQSVEISITDTLDRFN